MSDKTFSIGARIESFRFAFSGLWSILKTQHNAWLHLSATVLVSIAGVWLRISPADWRWLVVAIVLVWFAEAMNTAFEYLCDVVSPEFHSSVKRAKDIAAGAVLICAAGAAGLGAMVFLPYLAK